MKPTIHLTNAASRRPPHRGPGRVLTIMAAPRLHLGEGGEGSVKALVPPLEPMRAALAEMKAGATDGPALAAYRALYDEQVADRLRAGALAPGMLDFWLGGWSRLVRDGDTLICACSRAAAAEGRCHRVWSAAALHRAGWRVVLDGVEVLAP